MSNESSSLESLDERGNGVRVEFEKHGDRFGHTIYSVREGAAVALLRSLEGTPDEFAPPSPPFAELHRQGDLLFLSGATTAAHWSMSVEAAGASLTFDVACRMKAELDQIGNSYSIIDASYGQTVAIDALDDSVLDVGNDRVGIRVAQPQAASFPMTLRWQYSLSLKAK